MTISKHTLSEFVRTLTTEKKSYSGAERPRPSDLRQSEHRTRTESIYVLGFLYDRGAVENIWTKKEKLI